MSRPALISFALALCGCAGGSPAPAPAPAPPRASAEIPPPPPPATAPAVDAGSSDAPGDAAPEAEPEPIVRGSFALRKGLAPCKFVFRAGVGSQNANGRYLMGISRIETEASEVCAAHVVYDAESERKRDPDALDALEGGFLPDPGKLDAARAEPEGPEPVFVDANFDGYLDLAVGAVSGAYNRSSRFWLYDPASKRFVPSNELEALLMPRFDAAKKRVKAGGRAGGPVYVGSEHEWVGGKLETVWSETTYLGETPQGQPLPKGFRSWKVRYERRGGTQKKVHDGPAR